MIFYLGKTSDLHNRFYNHHKEQCIRSHGANCIGICADEEFSDKAKLEAAERDILAANNFSCNDQNN